jgi:mannose-6-phosphate isomerase-like protein (cupin superfamily)
MAKNYVVPLKDAVTGVLHGKAGTFRLLIDEEISGAKHFSLMINTMNAGVEGSWHKHDENEHCWYILSGRGTMYISDESYEIGPEMAVFAPANVMHKIDVAPDEDLTYVLIYAPPGPEQKLKEKGEHAFDEE